ncbi:MAG TPA: APC family permease [Ktedonobacteraceae bacterium]|nr:APC family permease [Ktedonobacteraceae bacterium]
MSTKDVSSTYDDGNVHPSSSHTGHTVAATELKAGALHLPEVLMQSVTCIAPAIAALFFTPAVVGFAGITSPLAYPIAFVITLLLGIVLVQFTKKIPAAGGYYTYISRSLHPRAGWLVAWLFILYAPTVGGIVSLYMGNILLQEFQSNWGLNWTWFPWVFMIVIVVGVALIQYRGVSISGRALLILGLVEMGLVMLLAIWSIANPGSGGINFISYNPGNITNFGGFALAIVFSLQAFTGWDGAAPLGEETEDPTRNISRAVIGSIILLGVFLIFVTWAIIIGWGTNNISSLPGSSELPAIVVSKRVWGPVWWLILFALLNSTIAVVMACSNMGSRMWFAMARSGSLPKVLTKVHPVYKSPVNTIILQLVVNLVTGLGLLWWLGAVNGYFYESFALALAVIIVYAMGNVGVFVLYLRQYRSEFNIFYHAIFPFISLVALGWLGYELFNPFPTAPIVYGLPTVGIWLLIGILIMVVMAVRGKEEWITKAGQSAFVIPEEAAEKPA